jgi:hypothetical protein
MKIMAEEMSIEEEINTKRWLRNEVRESTERYYQNMGRPTPIKKMPMGPFERDPDEVRGPITITEEYKRAFARAKQKEIDDWNKQLAAIKIAEIRMQEKKMLEMIAERDMLTHHLKKLNPTKEKNVIKIASLKHQINVLNDQIDYIKKITGLTYEEPKEEPPKKISFWQRVKTGTVTVCTKIKKKVKKFIRRNWCVVEAVITVATVVVCSTVKSSATAVPTVE